jgi:large subunit ribosomal protein L16
MGSGKGVPEFWVAVVRPGTIMFEMGGIKKAVAAEAIELARHKLPIRTRMVTRAAYEE